MFTPPTRNNLEPLEKVIQLGISFDQLLRDELEQYCRVIVARQRADIGLVIVTQIAAELITKRRNASGIYERDKKDAQFG